MFNETKLKLTTLYLTILMVVTISFSYIIYSMINQSMTRALEGQKNRIERQLLRDFPEQDMKKFIFKPFNEETLHEVREKIILNLSVVNIVILLISGFLAYYLAEKTLKPIEEMSQRQTRFISDAAHELKTPLTAIKTDLEVSLRDKNLTLEQAKESIKSTIEEIDSMTEITNNLLLQSKYKSNKYQLEKTKLDLKRIVEKETARLLNKANQKGIVLIQNLTEAKILGDNNSIQNAVLNIIDNAIKYSPNDSKIEITLEKNSTTAIIEIRDNGIGIEKNELNQIFEPFYRADKSRKHSKTEGYGLGLSIAKEMIEANNGKISVKSAPQKGTTFKLEFPLA